MSFRESDLILRRHGIDLENLANLGGASRRPEAIARARESAGSKDVLVMGGADVIRRALRAGHVEELSISIAPVVLGGGERLFHDFDETVSLEHLRLLQSPFATHITYRVVR